MKSTADANPSHLIHPRRWFKPLATLGLLIFASVAFYLGLELRREEWFRTSPVRFESDVFNGFRWGRAANRPEVGLFQVYELDAKRQISGVRPIDYTPLRLMVVFLWAKWAAVHFPEVTAWSNRLAHVYELTLPMLRFNMLCELASSILVFLLIRMWSIRADEARRSAGVAPRPMRGVGRAMAGALLFWFNPAVIRSAQTYPQWDVWNMPFFLGAVLLACTDWWFAAGICFVIGTFLKGQILLVVPVLLLWPVFQLRFGALLRFISGFLWGAAMIALPWMLAPPHAIVWLGLALLAMAVMTPITLRLRTDYRWLLALSVAAFCICWPWQSDAPIQIRLLALAPLIAVVLLRVFPPMLLPHGYMLAAAVAVFMMMPLFNASSEWFTAGFEYSTQKIMMTAVPGTFNLPSILVESFDWPNEPNFTVTLPLIGREIVFRHLMLWLYLACLILCSIAAAVHDRRKDPRFLLAVVTPWLCFFVILTQMNNRYLMWAAGFSALLAGVDLGMALLGCIVSLIGWTAIAAGMNTHLSLGEPEHIRMFQALTPHLAWVLILAMLIYLYVAIRPRRGVQV